MDGLVYVFEMVDVNGKPWNKYVRDTEDPVAVVNGFKSLIDSGNKLTETVSLVEMQSGIIIKRVDTTTDGKFRSLIKKIVDGYRTSSAHLRA